MVHDLATGVTIVMSAHNDLTAICFVIPKNKLVLLRCTVMILDFRTPSQPYKSIPF